MYEKFLPGFPGVQKSMWIYEKLLQKYFPKIHSHLVMKKKMKKAFAFLFSNFVLINF